MKEIIITDKNSGGRLDKIIFRYLDKASPGFVYKMLRKKNITLNDKKASGSEKLEAGDSIKLYLSDETVARFKTGESFRQTGKEAVKAGSAAMKHNEKEGLTARRASAADRKAGRSISLRNMIVYEDENIIAVNKPAGLLSQKASAGDASANDFFLEYIPSDEFFTPGIANRLDRNTSGIVIAGKNLNAQRELTRAIAERDVTKIYLALVKASEPRHTEADGWITARALLSKDQKTNTVTIMQQPDPTDDRGTAELNGADPIITRYRAAGSGNGVSLVEVDLVTGKPHQIRAHMAFLGHPVCGDTKYGDAQFNRIFREKYGLSCQLLHAYKLEFTGMQGILEYLNGTSIEAEVPHLFKNILEGEGIWQPGDQEA